MADPSGCNFNFPRPATFVEPESESDARRRTLKALVWDKVPKRLIAQPIRHEFKSLVESFDWSFSWVLLGPTGSGKSTACVHLVRELLRRGAVNGGKDFDLAKSIFWARADTVIAAGADNSDHAWKLLHRAEHSKLMILDDLATSSSKTLLRIIEQRYDTGKPLVVTSGALSVAAFGEMVGGDGPLRWIFECGGARRGVVLNASTTPRNSVDVRPITRQAPAQAATINVAASGAKINR